MQKPYPAELYAKLHLGNPGDLDFYRGQCRGVGAILELGCGYGRVLETLVGEDRSLVGLDLNRGLLELAAKRLGTRRRVALVLGDMRCFAFRRKFDRILVPYSGLYCLLSGDEVTACFQCVADHLAPEGRLIFDAYSADAFHRELPSPEGADRDVDAIANIVQDGTAYQVVEQANWSRDEQRLDVVYTYEPRQGGHEIAAPIAHRYLLSDQIAPLLAAAGLELISLFGNYHGAPLTDDSDLIVATARLA